MSPGLVATCFINPTRSDCKAVPAEWLVRQCSLRPAPAVFPANREFYRELCKIAALGAPETANNGIDTGLAVRIP